MHWRTHQQGVIQNFCLHAEIFVFHLENKKSELMLSDVMKHIASEPALPATHVNDYLIIETELWAVS